MSDFNAAYPGYETTARLDELRATEYSYLDEGGHVHLDYTGAGLPARSQLHAHAARLRSGVYGNPHPDNPTSSATTLLGPPTGIARGGTVALNFLDPDGPIRAARPRRWTAAGGR